MILFDSILAIALAVLAWRCISVPDMHRAIVLFIVLGFTLALAWTRLGAPDVALGEAAIGGGLLGVLLLSSWRSLGSPRGSGTALTRAWPPAARRWTRAGAALVAVLIALVLHRLPSGGDSAGVLALASLNAAGTLQPVTAVLLDFRALDTLMELIVLLMALFGVMLCRVPLPRSRPDDGGIDATELAPPLVYLFAPLLIVTGAWLVWAGSHAPGGAFQGGAVIAGAGVLLTLGGQLGAGPDRGGVLRLLLSLGILVFIAIGLMVIPEGGGFLAYPPGLATTLLLTIEYAVAISLALALLLLYTGSEGLRRRQA